MSVFDGPVQSVSILSRAGSASDHLTLNVLHGEFFDEELRGRMVWERKNLRRSLYRSLELTIAIIGSRIG